MARCLALVSLFFALVAMIHGQDMTSMMFQMMGVDAPPMPPEMPSSLRQALYPQSTQNRQRALAQAQYRQRQLAAAAAARGNVQQVPYQGKPSITNNPYSVSYSSSFRAQPSGQNSVYSPANMIRRPGTVNTIDYKSPANPYSTSRQAGSRVPAIRYQAMAKSPVQMPSTRASEMLKMYKKIQSQPKKMREAQMAGCSMPDGPEGILMAQRCRSQAAQMVCSAKMMSCVDIELMSMCCPLGMNRLAMDTLSYVKKLQHFMAEVA